MEKSTGVLLVTANIGSLFEGELQSGWLQEFYKTIRKHNPQFIAVHFQEVGGKDYMTHMDQAESFFCNIESSEEMKDFNRACIYIDNEFQSQDNFTALGSMYFIHKTLKNIYQYDFNAKDFKAVQGKNKYMGSLDRVSTVEKEKFSRNFWPDFKWSRKGYMRTRWIIHDQGLDLVNIHLFHDVSNLVACNSTPSIYSTYRKNALSYTIQKISDERYPALPFFLFGDFNFRLDSLSLIQHLALKTEVQTVKKDSSNKIEKIVCEEKDSSHQVLCIEDKLFQYLHEEIFIKDNGKEIFRFDKEVRSFRDILREEEIKFPPSYPFSEDFNQPTQYMNTRCPAWCDRILMSHSANKFINRSDDEEEEEEKGVVYNMVGSNVCMGDHKPVFLFFPLKTNNH